MKHRLRQYLPWLVPITLVVALVTAHWRSGTPPPIPFLLIYASVVVATGGGRTVGMISAAGATLFIFYSAYVGFGPPTLTGGVPQAIAGATLHLATGWLLGGVQERNRSLIDKLEQHRDQLERKVQQRTSALQTANLKLQNQIAEHQATQQALDESEASLRHRQRLESVGVLAAGIAHDFNNLLTAILTNTAMAQDSSSPETKTLLDEVHIAGERAAALCRLMLSYAGMEDVEPTQVDVVSMVNETISFVGASVSKKVLFNVSLSGKPTVHGDATQLGQLMLNLFQNAAEAVEGHGEVTVSAKILTLPEISLDQFLVTSDLGEGPYLSLIVEDTGIGMSAAQQERIFEPFYSTKFDGRGLGLAVVFGTLHAHQGAIAVTSEVGTGTRFEVLLPAADLSVSLPKNVHVPTKVRENALPGTILVADDEGLLLRACTRALERVGWTVVTATNGEEALFQFGKNPRLSAVVVDLTMPVMDGAEAIRQIRQKDANIPIVLMSGHGSHVRHQLTGPSAFLQKPFMPQDLVQAVATSVSTDSPDAH